MGENEGDFHLENYPTPQVATIIVNSNYYLNLNYIPNYNLIPSTSANRKYSLDFFVFFFFINISAF